MRTRSAVVSLEDKLRVWVESKLLTELLYVLWVVTGSHAHHVPSGEPGQTQHHSYIYCIYITICTCGDFIIIYKIIFSVGFSFYADVALEFQTVPKGQYQISPRAAL